MFIANSVLRWNKLRQERHADGRNKPLRRDAIHSDHAAPAILIMDLAKPRRVRAPGLHPHKTSLL